MGDQGVEAGQIVVGILATHVALDQAGEVLAPGAAAARVGIKQRKTVVGENLGPAQPSVPVVAVDPHRSAVHVHDQREGTVARRTDQPALKCQPVTRPPLHGGNRAGVEALAAAGLGGQR